MIRHWLAGAAALALMSGVASAQTVTEQRSTIVEPATGAYSASKSERATDANGTQVDRHKEVTRTPMGSKSSERTEVNRPDGSSATMRREQYSTNPSPVPETTTTTTTTRTVR